MAYLPNEILYRIFNDLSLKDLFACRLVCRQWDDYILKEAQYHKQFTYHLNFSYLNAKKAQTRQPKITVENKANGEKSENPRKGLMDLDQLLILLERHTITRISIKGLNMLFQTTTNDAERMEILSSFKTVTEKLCELMCNTTHLYLNWCCLYVEQFRALLRYCPLESVHCENTVINSKNSLRNFEKVFNSPYPLESDEISLTHLRLEYCDFSKLDALGQELATVRNFYYTIRGDLELYHRELPYIFKLPSLTHLTVGPILTGFDELDPLFKLRPKDLLEITFFVTNLGRFTYGIERIFPETDMMIEIINEEKQTFIISLEDNSQLVIHGNLITRIWYY